MPATASDRSTAVTSRVTGTIVRLRIQERVMPSQKTLVLCKPDAVARGLVGEIIRRYEARGYTLAAMKLMQVDEARAKLHYAEHEGKPFYNGLVSFITKAPSVAMIIEGSDAIEGCRTMNGATNPLKAAPGSIRGDLGQSVQFNLVHASDSAESAAREIGIFFDAEEILARQ